MLVDALLETARTRGRVEAVADATVRLTYDKLVQFALVMRDVIQAHTQAERVGVMLPASAAFSGCLFGALWANRVVVPLNFLLSGRELGEIVTRAELDLVITVRYFEALAGQLPARCVFLEDVPIKRKMVGRMFRRTPAAPRVEPDDTAVLLFTSGTAGVPKGVELSHRNLHADSADCVASARMTGAHRFLNCLPPFHVFGLTGNVVAPAIIGASVYCVPRFLPLAVAKAIADERISIMMAIPSMYGALLRLKSAPVDLMKDVYLLVSGGEPLSDTLVDGFQVRFGVRLLQGYGLSETSPVCTLELPWAHKRGSIGRPIRNVEIRIAGTDGEEAPPDCDGEILVQGPNVMKGYFGDPQATREAIDADGWFHTGDAGRKDEEGYVTITGRIKEMLIVGGENIYPREIEAVMEEHPAVAEVAVIGAPDSGRGEVPVAFVICKDGQQASELELREFARGRLAGFKVPRQVRIADDLPRGPTGKLLKRVLHDLL